VIGMGGIESGADAADFLVAGATAIAVGTASFRDPLIATRIRTELSSELISRGFDGLPSEVAA
jgi:dihydroorotate dehydrogenase (NAD+) catalytic subunit